MGNLILPKRFHQDFSVVGKKPLQSVEIDHANKSSRALSVFFLGGRFPLPGIDTMTRIIHSGGPSRNILTGTNERIEWASSLDIFRKQDFTVSISFTMDSPGQGFIFNQDFRFNIANAKESITNLGVSWFDGAFRNLTFGIAVLDVPLRIIFTKKLGVSVEAYLYVSGNKTKVTNSINTDAIVYKTDRSGSLGAKSGGDVNQGFTTQLHDFFYFDKHMGEAEIDALASDPYQVLKPTIPPSYFVPEAVGGVTTFFQVATYAATGTPGTQKKISKSIDYTATGTALGSTVATFRQAAAYVASGSLTVSKMIKKSVSYIATGTLTALKKLSKSVSYIATGTSEAKEGIFLKQSASYTATGTAISTVLKILASTQTLFKAVFRTVFKSIFHDP